MKFEHTPGPLLVVKLKTDGFAVADENAISLMTVAEEVDGLTGEVHHFGCIQKEADAKLIAAAPVNLTRDIEANKMARAARTIGTAKTMESVLCMIVEMMDNNLIDASGKTWAEIQE